MHDIAPIIAAGMFFMIPIIVVLTRHQQKMAMILNSQRVPGATEAELAALRDLVYRQTAAIDDLTRSQAELKAALQTREQLTERVSGLN